MPNEREYAERRFAGGLGMRAQAGRCCDCARPIALTALWCAEHRKTGQWVVQGKKGPVTMPWTYEESEANHAARMQEMIAKGRA